MSHVPSDLVTESVKPVPVPAERGLWKADRRLCILDLSENIKINPMCSRAVAVNISVGV